MSTLTALKPSFKSLGQKIRILPPLDTPAPPDTPLVQILDRARSYVVRGWIQGMAQNTLGTKVCAQWAIEKAMHELDYPVGKGILAQSLLLQTIHNEYGVFYPNIPTWNDFPGRTKVEVLRTYDNAISIARKVGA